MVERINVTSVGRGVVAIGTGPRGPQGLPGDAGASAAAHYTHVQSSAATLWTINHNLGFIPNLQSFDSFGDEVDGGVVNHVSVNQCTITWSPAIGGHTYCS